MAQRRVFFFIVFFFLHFVQCGRNRSRGVLIQKRHQRGKLVNGKPILTDDSDNIRVFQLDNLLVKSFQPGGQLFNLFCNTVTLSFEFFNAGIQNSASFQGVGSLP